MAAILAPFSPSHFKSLSTLDEAHSAIVEARATYQKEVGGDLINNHFRDLFVKADVDTRFGLSMLHRHFDIKPDQRLVEYRGTSTPWEGEIAGMGELQPSIWGFDGADKQLKPTEFHYSGKEDAPLTAKDLQFAYVFFQELVKLGLTRYLGLSRYPGDDFEGSCEITQGQANINLKPADVSVNFSFRLACA